jgi:hypothetical protein
VKQLLEHFSNRLLDLSGNNPNLLLRRLRKGYHFDWLELDFLAGISSFDALGKVFSDESIRVAPLHHTRDQQIAKFQTIAKRLLRAASTAEAETGSGQLFITWPWVTGCLPDGQFVHAPLLYIPVRLEAQAGFFTISINAWDEPVWNRTLFLRIQKEFSDVAYNLPDQQILKSKLEDLTVFRTFLYEWLRDQSIPISCSSRWFENRLDRWQERPKETTRTSSVALQLQYYAAMGLFRPMGSFIAEDYRAWVAQNIHSSLEEFLADRFATFDLAGGRLKENTMLAPIVLDSSQEACYRHIRSGGSLVVQGPPGSGKSQLIAALAADYMASGKSVLVVAQKKVALEVVRQRLDSMQLGAFVAELHHFKNDKQMLYQSLDAQIEALEEYQSANNTYESIRLEREFSAVCVEIDQLTTWLEEWKSATYATNNGGYALHELYLMAKAGVPADAATSLVPAVDIPTWDTNEGSMQAWLVLASSWLEAPIIWQFYAPNPLQTPGKYILLLEKLQHDLLRFCTAIHSDEVQFPTDSCPEWLQILSKETQTAKCVHAICLKTEGFGPYELLQCLQSATSWHYPDTVWEYSTLKALAVEAESWLLAQSGWFGRLSLLIKPKSKVWKDCFKKTPSEKEVHKLLKEVKQIQSVLSIANELGLSVQSADDRKVSIRILEKSFGIASEVRFFFGKEHLETPPDWGIAYDAWKALHASTTKVLDTSVMAGTCANTLNQLEDAIQYGQAHTNELRQLYQLGTILYKVSPALLPFLWGQVSNQASFENARWQLIKAWIQYLELANPEACRPGHPMFYENIKRLQVLVERKQTLSRQLITIRLRERTYTALQYNRLQNRVSYRALQKQVRKKKQIWPVRKLVESFGHEIFDLKPCWLMNPESVSVCLPRESKFDLVIFDEASQLFPEQGLAALMRGKQVMVAGDSKQLPPGQWYQMRYEYESDDTAPEVLSESLLDLMGFLLPGRLLRGHYRSKHAALIQFANTHFYGGKLQMLPERQSMHEASSALQWHFVAGVWQEQTNIAEAIEAVRQLKTALENRKSVGIITFNYKQQQLVLDLLEMEVLPPDSAAYWVKNIENVQGDEADVVLFSVTYAPNEEGALHTFFGVLNQLGGEKRLNVAITRARESMIVLCSFQPSQLDVSGAMHEGPRLLKSFLQYAQSAGGGESSVLPKPTSEADTLCSYLLRAYTNSQRTTFSALSMQDERGTLLLTDGSELYSEPSMKQYFGVLPLHVREKGWFPVFYTAYAYHHGVPLL